MTNPDLFIFAGETSGDLRGEELLTAIRTLFPKWRIVGVGGPKMRPLMDECWLPMEQFQVMGFIDVFLALPKIAKHFFFLRKKILLTNPKYSLFIDYPGFNLRLERSLKKRGYQGSLIHYICPSVWAWGKGRIPLMAASLDQLLTILPFEKECFAHTPLAVHYMGHPLVKKIAHYPHQIPAELAGKKVLSLFPGSRKKELHRNLPIQLRAAKRALELDPSLQLCLSIANPAFAPYIKELCHSMQIPILFFPQEQCYNLMKASYLAIATSGTITLELALHQVPTIVTYGISPLDLFLAKYLFRISLPFYSLANIITNEEIFPELMGPHLTEEALFSKTALFLQRSDLYASCQKKCAHLTTLLGELSLSEEIAAVFGSSDS